MPPPSKPPTPPIVDCEQGKTEDLTPFPALPAGAPITDTWMRSVYGWANQTTGVVTQERQLRTIEHGCLAKLRAKGVIR